MAATKARAYLSPTLVLLALDWPDGEARNDFLGFAIQRTPGFLNLSTNVREASSWLPNRLGFSGPPPEGQPDFPSDKAPVQKFMWWDARFEGLAPANNLQYDVWAVVGDSKTPQLDPGSQATLTVNLPPHVEFGIGTWFNRAVMSSQAFSRKVAALNLNGAAPSAAQALDLRQWLANSMEKPIPDFVAKAAGSNSAIAGAIYHLTDNLWIIPALQVAMENCPIELVYDSHETVDSKTKKKLPSPNEGAIATLSNVTFDARDKTKIMHNKFIVESDESGAKPKPIRVACGSANYTTEGLTSQANLIHTFEAPGLADLYHQRFLAIKGNPTLGKTAAGAAWSDTVSVGDTGIRVFYSPEKGKPNVDRGDRKSVV